jgi:hypothetical protein
MMKERVGATPKQFARIARFSRALRLARAQPEKPWPWIALEAG